MVVVVAAGAIAGAIAAGISGGVAIAVVASAVRVAAADADVCAMITKMIVMQVMLLLMAMTITMMVTGKWTRLACARRDICHPHWLPVQLQPHCLTERTLGMLAARVSWKTVSFV